MPRENVHWLVAERSAALLASGPFGPALARCPNGLRLGAVLHDVLYYLRGEHPEALKELPHRLHGAHGEDTFELLRLYARHMFARRDDPLPTAVFVGLSAHIFADALMHPLVYHLTGNYYDPDPQRRTRAIRNHRALEALLDMVAAGGPDAVLSRSLREVVDGLEGRLSLALPAELLGGMAGVESKAAGKALGEALDTYCTMQALCRMPTLSRWLHDLRAWLPDKAREIAALFYAPQLWEGRAAFSGPMTYRNPYSAEAATRSLAELMDLAVRHTVLFCQGQAPGLAARGELTAAAPGPSLDMGLPGAPASRATHFSERPLPFD